MSSALPNKMLNDLLKGNLNFGGGGNSFKIMLVTSSFSFDKDSTHYRSDVTNEVTGTGYTAGGKSIAATLTEDLTNDRQEISWANTSWASSTITARGAVIYKDSGSSATDIVVCYLDFGSDVSSTNASFAITFSSAIRFQN